MNRAYPRLLGGRFAEWSEGAAIVPGGPLAAPKDEVLRAPMGREEGPPVDPPTPLELDGTFAPLALGGEIAAPEDLPGSDDRPGDIESERARISRRIALTTIALLGGISVAIGIRISLSYAPSPSDHETAALQAPTPAPPLPVPSIAPAEPIEVGTTTATSGSVSTEPAKGGVDPGSKAAAERATLTAPRSGPLPDSGSPPPTSTRLVPIKSSFEVQN
jgi:hypothetical protein